MKKIVVISSSPRKNGNSETLALELARGAEEAGGEVTFLRVADLKLNFCTGCMACQKLNRCVLKDGATDVMETVRAADTVVFASPVYYYAVSGQLKTFLDRMNPIYTAGHHFTEVALISTAAEDDRAAMEGSIKDIQGWVDCFDGVSFEKVLCGTGLEGAGDVRNRPALLQEAYEMGKSLGA